MVHVIVSIYSVYERAFVLSFSSSFRAPLFGHKEMCLDSHSSSEGRGDIKYK